MLAEEDSLQLQELRVQDLLEGRLGRAHVIQHRAVHRGAARWVTHRAVDTAVFRWAARWNGQARQWSEAKAAKGQDGSGEKCRKFCSIRKPRDVMRIH